MIHLKKPQLDTLEYESVLEVLKSGIVAQGPKVAEFEDRFASKCGAEFGVFVNSGTAALHCILLALDIGPGDEVICPSFTFIATASPILMCGATPVFVDIDEATYNIDVSQVMDALTPRTKAVIGVNLFGGLADWSGLSQLCREQDLYLLEDAAQSHFACNEHATSGGFATASWFSFYATKNMMTAEGGMIVTNCEQIDQRVRRIRQHGMSEPGMYDYTELGFNYRSTDINAAIGLAQLEKIDGFNNKRINIARRYNEAFAIFPELNLPASNYLGNHVYHLYTIGLNEPAIRDPLVNSIRSANVGCGVYYPTPLPDLSIFKRFTGERDFPNAKRASQTVISIPCEPFLEDDEIEFVIDTFSQSYRNLRGVR